MKISIVTAVYNRAATIGDTIASVQAQSAPDVEHVIQDGASTDGTLDIIKDAADAQTHVESEADNGIYDAINRGIERAQGDVIGLLHSDDVFADSDILAQIQDTFSDGVDGVYGDLDYVAYDNSDQVIRRWRSGTYHRSKLRRGWMPPHPTLYLRREVFQKWGAYDRTFSIAADYDAMLRWLIKGEINLAYVPRVFIKMRVGGASNGSLSQILRKSREDYRAIRRNGAGGFGTLALKNLSKLKQFAPGDR